MKEAIHTVYVYDYGTYWYLNGKRNRINGPAIECFSYRAWYLNGKRHRTNGPAFEYSNGDKYWYLNGKQYYSNNKIFKVFSNSFCFRPNNLIDSSKV